VQAGGTATFTATVANATNAGVVWEVNGFVGGKAASGTITSAGVYSAPASVPTPATVTITAVSAIDASATGSAQMTITAPPGSGGHGGGGTLDWVTLLAGGAVLASIARRRRA
jgi:hypothetical protein